MTNVASLAGVAALIGDPARAAMLVTLMDGRALTAGELGQAAGVAPPTASGHLGRMLDAGLLALERQGRHRYYRIDNEAVAALLESMMSLSGALAEASGRSRPVRTGPRDAALRRARRCYDHLAGEVAVGMTASMVSRGQLALGPDGGVVTEQGFGLLAALGVELAEGAAGHGQPTAFCRPCLDWSERRPHVAGVVGRTLYAALLRAGWIREAGTGRAVAITPAGRKGFAEHFGLETSQTI
jgi:DNA-binding transcriptional ArsR family regulator